MKGVISIPPTTKVVGLLEMVCMNFYSKKFKIKFNKPGDPNYSNGNLIVFYGKDNNPVAHLSLTWISTFWFAYHCNGKWLNCFFPVPFNTFSFNDEIVEFDFIISKNKIVWKLFNLVNEVILSKNLEFDYVKTVQDPQTKSSLSITRHTNINMSDSDLELQKDALDSKINTTILLVGFKSSPLLRMHLNTLLMTYKGRQDLNVNISKIIYCDNNANIPSEREISKGIINEFKNECKNIIDVQYIENDDVEYCKNRLTAISKTLQFIDTDIVTIVEPDVIFLNHKWINSYKYFNLIDDLVGCSTVSSTTDRGRYMRHSCVMLPRICPFFAHFKTDFLKKQINEDPLVLNDLDLSWNFSNIKIQAMGLHFSKLYLNILDKKLPFYIFNTGIDFMERYDIIEHIKMNVELEYIKEYIKMKHYMALKKSAPMWLKDQHWMNSEIKYSKKNGFLKHIKARSFEEFDTPSSKRKQYSLTINALEKYVIEVNYNDIMSEAAIYAIKYIKENILHDMEI